MNRRSIVISAMGLAIAGLVSCQLFDRESLTAPAGGGGGRPRRRKISLLAKPKLRDGAAIT